jgi:hypothetical protein
MLLCVLCTRVLVHWPWQWWQTCYKYCLWAKSSGLEPSQGPSTHNTCLKQQQPVGFICTCTSGVPRTGCICLSLTPLVTYNHSNRSWRPAAAAKDQQVKGMETVECRDLKFVPWVLPSAAPASRVVHGSSGRQETCAGPMPC